MLSIAFVPLLKILCMKNIPRTITTTTSTIVTNVVMLSSIAAFLFILCSVLCKKRNYILHINNNEDYVKHNSYDVEYDSCPCHFQGLSFLLLVAKHQSYNSEKDSAEWR